MGRLRLVWGWVDSRRDGIVVVLLCLSLLLNVYTINKLGRDERASITNGIPSGVCLLETFRGVEPLLARSRDVQAPLHAFLVLQGRRYEGHRCPDRPGEAASLSVRLPKVH